MPACPALCALIISLRAAQVFDLCAAPPRTTVVRWSRVLGSGVRDTLVELHGQSVSAAYCLGPGRQHFSPGFCLPRFRDPFILLPTAVYRPFVGHSIFDSARQPACGGCLVTTTTTSRCEMGPGMRRVAGFYLSASRSMRSHSRCGLMNVQAPTLSRRDIRCRRWRGLNCVDGCGHHTTACSILAGSADLACYGQGYSTFDPRRYPHIPRLGFDLHCCVKREVGAGLSVLFEAIASK